MLYSKISEKMKFIFYVRKALIALGLTSFSDGRYIKGEMVIKLKEDSLLRKENQAKFKSEKLNNISKKYGLINLDQLFREDTEEILKGLYRLNFERKDLDMREVAAEYEKDETCVFATPNFLLAPLALANSKREP